MAAPVQFSYGSHMERFKQSRFLVPTVSRGKDFLCVSVQVKGMGQFWFRFRFLKNGSGSEFGSWKMVPTVPVSGSVPAPS